MSNPARIGQEAPDLKTPSSPSRITPTRALDDDAEHQMMAGATFVITQLSRGDDDDESFHTASALTPSSLASV